MFTQILYKVVTACFHKEIVEIRNCFLNILVLIKQFVMIGFTREVGTLV